MTLESVAMQRVLLLVRLLVLTGEVWRTGITQCVLLQDI